MRRIRVAVTSYPPTFGSPTSAPGFFCSRQKKPVSHRLPAGVKPNKRPSHLFQGFSTVARPEQASQNLDQYQLQRNAVREKISLRVRAQMENVKAAHFAIQQSQLAEVAARKGLEIVTDGYSRGGVSILSLLDAQNSSLRTDLVAANALYDFFVAYMQLQRSIGKFDILMTPEARLEMLDRVLQSMKAALKK